MRLREVTLCFLQDTKKYITKILDGNDTAPCSYESRHVLLNEHLKHTIWFIRFVPQTFAIYSLINIIIFNMNIPKLFKNLVV